MKCVIQGKGDGCMFPIITSKKQKEFEKYCIRNNITSDESKCNVPCICGYYGRACRQTNDEANRMICLDCSLRIFVSTVETIIEICDEKEKIGISHLYDSDILDIQSKLKKECVIDVECSYIENVLNYLIESDS